MPGRIPPVELGVNPLRSKAFNRQCNLNEFTPILIYTQFDQSNLTGRIRLVELGVNPSRL